MNIVIGGMPQSGSTALYNIVYYSFKLNDISSINKLYQNKTTLYFDEHDYHDNWKKAQHDIENSDQHVKKILQPIIIGNNTIDRVILNDRQILMNVFNVMLNGQEDSQKRQASNFLSEQSSNFNISMKDLYIWAHNNMILKCHHHCVYLEEWADLIFISTRDIRDSIASRRRKNKGLYSKDKREQLQHDYNEKTFYGFKAWCDYLVEDCFEKWKSTIAQEKLIYFNYENFIYNNRETITEIYKNIFSNTDKEVLERSYVDFDKKIDKIVEYTSIENIGKVSSDIMFFSKDKITNNGKIGDYSSYLTQQEIDHISKVHKSHIVEE